MGNAALGTRNNAVKIAASSLGSTGRTPPRLGKQANPLGWLGGYGHAHQQGTVQREGLEPAQDRAATLRLRCRLRPEQLDPYA